MPFPDYNTLIVWLTAYKQTLSDIFGCTVSDSFVWFGIVTSLCFGACVTFLAIKAGVETIREHIAIAFEKEE